jgi:oligopeptide transport system ATP-binding protein
MRQRVMIAMALSCNPKLLLADEPTTALDVTIQAQILELIRSLSAEFGTAVILITHDLGIAAGMCDRINVMYAGRIIETGTAKEIFANPKHPYTLGLLRSVPRLDESRKEKLEPIEGVPPDLVNLPKGCSFYPRCRFHVEKCLEESPPLMLVNEDHFAACWENERVGKDKEFPPLATANPS